MHFVRYTPSAVAAICAALMTTACAASNSGPTAATPQTRADAPASSPPRPAPAPTAPSAPDPIRSAPRAAHPGFDTRVFPGETALRAWREHSPYEWIGYYLVAPCQKGTTYVGRRQQLRDIGWGTAVIFIGEQDWPDAVPDSSANTSAVSKQCTVANLTEAKATSDAARADSAAAGEGFPEGTVVFLDVERVEAVSGRLEAYVRAWIRAMLARGRFTPGIYSHERNANALQTIAAAELANAGRAGSVPMWIASRTGFDIALAPQASGFAFATIWQGTFNVSETWGGVSLVIDANVAASADPSGAIRR